MVAPFGDFNAFVILFALLGAIVIAAGFVLLGMEGKWRLRVILPSLLLIVGAGAFGYGGGQMLGPMGLRDTGPPREVALKEAKEEVEFTIYLPARVPEGMKRQGITVMPGPEPKYKSINVGYFGEGNQFNLQEMKAGVEGGPFGMGMMPFPPGTKSRKIEAGKFKGRVGTSDTMGGSMVVGLVGKTSVTISGNLEEDQLIEIAKSLRAVK